MEKILYWLKKLGIFRSASYKVKGDASKLAKMHASDGGMIQSQKEIDKEYIRKKGKKGTPEKKEKGKTKVLFWIFTILAALFLLAFFGSGFSFWSFVVTLFWAVFLFFLWKGKVSWTDSLVKVLVFGLILIVLSFSAVDSTETEQIGGSEIDNSAALDAELVSDEGDIEEGECDDANSEHASFNKVEKVIVSKNPCKVPWILAKEAERYTLETERGTELQVIVWNNYINNTQPGESYTIRALDVEDTQKMDQSAGVSVVRWVPNKAALVEAKKEVKKVVENLEY